MLESDERVLGILCAMRWDYGKVGEVAEVPEDEFGGCRVQGDVELVRE